MRKIWLALLLGLLAPMLGLRAQAADISGMERITDQQGFGRPYALFDGSTLVETRYAQGSWLTLEDAGGIGSLYLIFNLEYGPYTLTNNDTGEVLTLGEYGILHEFADLEAAFGTAPTSVTVRFDSGEVRLNELYMFSPGEVPDFVQKWQPPAEGETDILLFSTHGDDEQLFFAGLLPYYHGELGCKVQVVYYTDHRNMNAARCHEMLNGLWAVGVDTYPVFGGYPDLLVTTMKQSYEINALYGITEEEVLEFVVTQLRRFKPMVAVGHDILAGEYGHGQHMMYADLLCKALEITMDPEQFSVSAERYGTWDVPKTYLHLWPENTVTMDWDKPLERFGGMTAYQVTKELGYPCHKTQYYDFLWYFHQIDAAADIEKYSPCAYGLYRSTVGPDVLKNDLMENVDSYAVRKQKAEDARLEAERLAVEEAARQAEETAKKETPPPETTVPAPTETTITEATTDETEEQAKPDIFLPLMGLILAMLILAKLSQLLRGKIF